MQSAAASSTPRCALLSVVGWMLPGSPMPDSTRLIPWPWMATTTRRVKAMTGPCRDNPDLVVLAGFMRILTPGLVRHYQGRMINIHPSLLPALRGLNTHQRALDEGLREHGASVHLVTEELDGGPVIVQVRVPVLEGDDAEKLAERVLKQEHRLYLQALQWLAAGRLQWSEGQLLFDGRPLQEQLLLNSNC